jgi:hypothetical protein
MLSRALSLATVTLLIGCFAPGAAEAQNLEAGKSPSQIFAGTCSACHKSPRGLLKTVAPGSLPGFLRQHYTTSSDMAGLLSAFLVSNGAADTRYVGTPPKAGSDAKPEAKPGGQPDQLDRFGRRLRPAAPQEAEPREAARPDADGLSPQGEPGRHGRNAKRFARPGEPSEAARPAAEGQTPDQAAGERGPDGRKLTAKQRLSKRGRPAPEEPPKSDAAKEEPATGEAAKEDAPKTENAKVEGGKPEEAKPSGSEKSESAKSEAPKETGSGESTALRADPVPPVTPAPAVSAGTSSGAPESAPPPSAPAPQPAPPAVTASAPPGPPAGPPAPPISQ